MSEYSKANEAGAALWQRDGEEIAAMLLSAMANQADREGREMEMQDANQIVGVLLSAAWTFIKIADSDEDGGRSTRYAKLLRSHADAIEASAG